MPTLKKPKYRTGDQVRVVRRRGNYQPTLHSADAREYAGRTGNVIYPYSGTICKYKVVLDKKYGVEFPPELFNENDLRRYLK